MVVKGVKHMEEQATKSKKNSETRMWIIYTALAILVVAVGGYIVVRSIPGIKHESAQSQTEQQKADTFKQSGIKAEANGDNQIALENYQAAFNAYRQAKNKPAVKDMGYKIEFMKQAIEASKRATAQAIKNGDAPSHE